MDASDYIGNYRNLLQHLIAIHGEARAMDLIVGGEFDLVGELELCALKSLHLRPEDNLIDVGCGSGRLAKKLTGFLTGRYIGTDILSELTDYAAKICARSDWKFQAVSQPVIPAPENFADLVCFFSVFTHLLDEDIFRYLQESYRVLRPEGRVVFSYLDFAVPTHWTIFELSLANTSAQRVLNKFISRDAIHAWASHLGFRVERLYDGPEPWINHPEPIVHEDGRVEPNPTSLGHSVGVLVKSCDFQPA